MTNKELHAARWSLEAKAEKVAGLPPWAAAGEIKAAAMLAAQITAELARRELMRTDYESDRSAAHE